MLFKRGTFTGIRSEVNRPWRPLVAACVPTAMNLWTSAVLRNRAPKMNSLGASAILLRIRAALCPLRDRPPETGSLSRLHLQYFEVKAVRWKWRHFMNAVPTRHLWLRGEAACLPVTVNLCTSACCAVAHRR